MPSHPRTVVFEAIYTFSRPIPLLTASEKPIVGTQAFGKLEVAVGDAGSVQEAEVLHCLLTELTAAERDLLAKVSLCLLEPEAEDCAEAAAAAKRLCPWLWEKDSPLFEGKLWLRQHQARSQVAVPSL
jgi:hypothetical protein